jgi:hypothetical protein
MMMSADAPRYVSGKKMEHVKIESEEQLSELIGKKYGK